MKWGECAKCMRETNVEECEDGLCYCELCNSMETPSLDRINNKGDYTFNNCRFIERRENSRRGALEYQAEMRKKRSKL